MSAQPARKIPRRRAELSQHFLRRGALASSLVGLTSIAASDLVVEIGPGTGALTRVLATRCRRLLAIELDQELCSELRREFSSPVEVVAGDFLSYELPRPPYKVMGSVPYARTTAIVRRLTGASRPPDDAWLVVQHAAARRFAGAPFAGESRLSLHLKPDWQVEILRSLRPTDFEPPPIVDSALLWLARRPRPLIAREHVALWRRFTANALAGPDVRRALRPWLTSRQLHRLARELRLELRARTSALRFDQWLALFRFIAHERRLG